MLNAEHLMNADEMIAIATQSEEKNKRPIVDAVDGATDGGEKT